MFNSVSRLMGTVPPEPWIPYIKQFQLFHDFTEVLAKFVLLSRGGHTMILRYVPLYSDPLFKKKLLIHSQISPRNRGQEIEIIL